MIKKSYKKYEIEKNNIILFREIVVINMFAVAQSVQSAFRDQELEFSVLDHMNETYFSYFKTEIKLDKPSINEHKQHLVERFKEYNEALSEKRGPNFLWPLALHMINNLEKDEIKDPIAVLKLSAHYSYLIQYFSKVISNFKIIQ